MYPKPKDLNATIFYDGQLNVWDDDTEESFGQVWMPVCIWCKRGPLSSWDGLPCEDHGQKFVHIDSLTDIWHALKKEFTDEGLGNFRI